MPVHLSSYLRAPYFQTKYTNEFDKTHTSNMAQLTGLEEPVNLASTDLEQSIPITPLYQGNTNGCGTASLAMAMNALSRKNTYTQTMIDRTYRKHDSFSSPGMLAKVAKKYGFQSSIYNHTTDEEILNHLRQGSVVIALSQPDKSNLKNSAFLHWSVIYGYTIDPYTRKMAWKICDPSYPDGGMARYTVSADDMRQTQTGNLKVGFVPLGVDALTVVISNRPLPPDRDISGTVAFANHLNSLINTVS